MAAAGAEGAATTAAGMATALAPPPPPGLHLDLDLELGVLAVEVTEEDLVEGLAAAVAAFRALEGPRGPGALLLWLSRQSRRGVTRATEPG